MRNPIALALTLVLVAAPAFAATSSMQGTSNKQQICQDLGELRAAVTNLQAVQQKKGSATIGEIQEAQDRVDKAAAAVKQDAIANRNTPAMQNVQKAAKDLHAAVQALPPSTTADQAKAKIKPQVDNLRNALGQVQKNLSCPRT